MGATRNLATATPCVQPKGINEGYPEVEIFLNIIALVGILGGSAWITNWFVRTMYNRCRNCGSLNAKRRKQCRACNQVMS